MYKWRAGILAVAVAISAASGFAAERHQPLYERLGGKAAVQAVVDDFAGRIFADERVNKWFAHAAADPEAAAAYKSKLADFVCQVTGGPCQYTGPDMKEVHRGRGITTSAFDTVVEDLTATLDKFRVPEREKADLLGMLGSMKPAVVQQ